MRLDGKTAVVTGAASGIGKAVADALADAGAHVVLGDLNADGGRAAKADFLVLDVTDLVSVESFRRQATAASGHVDIVANVAGWGKIQPFVENRPDYWGKVIDVNLLGPIAVTRAFIEPMIAKNAGRVITVASDAGRVGSTGETVYLGAKAGAIGFTKALAREVGRYNVTVNCVCPGPTDTPLRAAAGGTQRLARLCRHGVARRLIFGAEIITGAEAMTLGLVQWAAYAAALVSTVDGIVGRIAALSPEAVAASKACVAEVGVSGTAGFDLEIQSSARLLASKETQERVRQFLGGKR